MCSKVVVALLLVVGLHARLQVDDRAQRGPGDRRPDDHRQGEVEAGGRPGREPDPHRVTTVNGVVHLDGAVDGVNEKVRAEEFAVKSTASRTS
jgi:osmotically-inducible protein OsmY